MSGCAALERAPCASGLSPAHQAELFFGRDIAGQARVDDAEFAAFVQQEIVPRFPDGFTLSDAAGAWRDTSGRTISERSKRLLVLLSGTPDGAAKLDAIRADYKARFQQESVLLIETQVCAAF